MSKHTPPPPLSMLRMAWYLDERRYPMFIVQGLTKEQAVNEQLLDDLLTLFEAAPDLLEALEKLLHTKRHGNGLEAWWHIEEKAKAAIAKARGQE